MFTLNSFEMSVECCLRWRFCANHKLLDEQICCAAFCAARRPLHLRSLSQLNCYDN